MSTQPTFSLIVPTKGRVEQLRRLLDSVAATATHPMNLEVILVVDEDDDTSIVIAHARLLLRHVLVKPKLTMGDLNQAGYAASTGKYIMLLNDDVLARTKGWDEIVLAVFQKYPDEIALVHVNDTLMREHLCVFPIVSRTYCQLAGSICPADYIRYCIDDHIQEVFELLGILGEQRHVYLPEVVFEHFNAVSQAKGPPIYLANPEILALDQPYYEALFQERTDLALRLVDYIEEQASCVRRKQRLQILEELTNEKGLRLIQHKKPERKASLLRRICRRIGKVFSLGS